ncbi:hypothetical protein AMTR_s00003p00041070 [Amborella trichopoda]|uniref:Uncharacterized protein n=1 Tax=Amborella trichopoda TaxID=13333 RepID=W1P664_AMBTC|nr:hypothetical protein AMTR_s00003p00041070 [Amborella trichopoda]
MLKHDRVNLEGLTADVQFQVMADVTKLPQAKGSTVIEVRRSNVLTPPTSVVLTQDAKVPQAKGVTAIDVRPSKASMNDVESTDT